MHLDYFVIFHVGNFYDVSKDAHVIVYCVLVWLRVFFEDIFVFWLRISVGLEFYHNGHLV